MTDDPKPGGGATIVTGSNASTLRMVAALHGETAGSAPIKQPVRKAPTIAGPHGRAWPVDIDTTRKTLGVPPEKDGTLAMWVVEAAWAHPAWHSYLIMLVHLRPIAGTPTLLYLEHATHELWVYAMDPDADRDTIIEGRSPHPLRSCLTPLNFGAQFVEITDDLARERVAGAVAMIVKGALSPDVDHNDAWAALFGDNMLKDRRGGSITPKRRET